jgi:hypothetical protein
MEIKYIDTFWELLLPTNSGASQTPNRDWTRVLRDRYTSDGPFRNACNDEVIAVCLILSHYEIMCSPSSQGANWQSHLRGIGTLIQLRGPHSFAYGFSHKLFVSARVEVVSLSKQNILHH